MTRDLYDDPPYSEDFEIEELDPEGPSEADLERFGDEFRKCPECGSDVYDQTPLCPQCGCAFEQRRGTPVWVLATALAALAGLVLFFVL